VSNVSPRDDLALVASVVPEACRENIVIVGSLAAGYHLLGDNVGAQVQTKDVDCMLVPRVEAVRAGGEVARQLLGAGGSAPSSPLDLGRVVAIARLSGLDGPRVWPTAWEEALRACLGASWGSVGQNAGAGLRALLGSQADLDEACLTCNAGLLACDPVTPAQLRRVAERLLQDAIEPLEESARRLHRDRQPLVGELQEERRGLARGDAPAARAPAQGQPASQGPLRRAPGCLERRDPRADT
jgi:hypothetical protein